MTDTNSAKTVTSRKKDELSSLMNVGPAIRRQFQLLKIETIAELAKQDADDLFAQLSALSEGRVDPCVHDVFSATIHQARIGEALPWWHFSAARKRRQAN